MSSAHKKETLKSIIPMADRINQLLCTTGDGSGVTEMATATLAEYMYKPGPGVVGVILSLHIGIEDASKMAANLYGGITALTNGIVISIKDLNGATIHNFTPQPVQKTWHYGLMAGTNMTPEATAAGVDRVNIEYHIDEHIGGPCIINGDRGEYLSFNVTDDLSGLVSHIVQVTGYKAI